MHINRTNALLFVVIPVWLIAIIWGLFFASKSIETPFDFSGALYRASAQPLFDNEFSSLIFNALDKELSNAVIHIVSEDDCLCQLVASRHIQEVKEKAAGLGKTNITVNIKDILGLNAILSSTPAIAIFDDKGNLAYLGPYSTGIGCVSGNGTVEPYLDSKATLGAIMPLEATGCYCINV